MTKECHEVESKESFRVCVGGLDEGFTEQMMHERYEFGSWKGGFVASYTA